MTTTYTAVIVAHFEAEDHEDAENIMVGATNDLPGIHIGLVAEGEHLVTDHNLTGFMLSAVAGSLGGEDDEEGNCGSRGCYAHHDHS